PPVAGGRALRDLRKERNNMVVSFAVAVCDKMTAALSARRPSAGAVPSRTDFKSVPRWPVGGLLGGKDPTGRFSRSAPQLGTRAPRGTAPRHDSLSTPPG